MAEITQNKQSCLEIHGMDERKAEIVRNDYNRDDDYNVMHPDAKSDGDVQGKGAGGSHTDWQPYCSDLEHRNMIDYRNFITKEEGGVTIGGCYDRDGRNGIGGRNYSMSRSLYNSENPYGKIDTTANQNEGQYVVGYKQKIEQC